MNFIIFIFSAVFVFFLTPGILLSLPPGASKTVVAATHAIVFGAVWTLSHKMLMAIAY